MIDKNLHALEDPSRVTAARLSRQLSSLAFAQELSPKSMVRSISSGKGKDQRTLNTGLSLGPLVAKIVVTTAKKMTQRKSKAKVEQDWLLLGDIGS